MSIIREECWVDHISNTENIVKIDKFWSDIKTHPGNDYIAFAS